MGHPVGWKVRWVSESKFCGLSNGYEKFLCLCSRTRENNKNKVETVMWDTLYYIIHKVDTENMIFVSAYLKDD